MGRLKIDWLDAAGVAAGGFGLWLFFSSQILANIWAGFILFMLSLFGIGLRKR